jgi:tRNA pseudouridine38-40 synthase
MPHDRPRPEEAPTVRRVVLQIEYDGTRFHGLQRQAGTTNTIQEAIEKAARTVGSTNPRFIASGRTDAGVHALGQVIAVDLPERLEITRTARALNSLLPPDIRVRQAALSPEDFSPRLDARMRTYVYRVCARQAVPPMLRHYVAFTPYKLKPSLVHAAAESFLGKWEFREWRSSFCQAKRTRLTISDARAIPPDEPSDDPAEERAPYWRFVISARSFVHHQVRFMSGAIIGVGAGRIGLEELRSDLAAGRRPVKVKCEAACGLCLTKVQYPPEKDPFLRENRE